MDDDISNLQLVPVQRVRQKQPVEHERLQNDLICIFYSASFRDERSYGEITRERSPNTITSDSRLTPVRPAAR
jgi:hypothetical protein